VWSDPERIEMGLLNSQDWVARPICPCMTGNPSGPAPVFLLRRVFLLDIPITQARLYVTALGMHETFINGHRVSGDLMEPGWTAYSHRLLYAAYDVTELVHWSSQDLLETSRSPLKFRFELLRAHAA